MLDTRLLQNAAGPSFRSSCSCFHQVRNAFIGASLSEPHTDVLAWDSVTRDIYIYIGIGGPTAIFEPAPFLQPCTFFLARPRRSQAPHRAAHNAHTDAQYKAAEPRLLRAYQCKARLSPDSKKYLTSGRIGFLFSLGLDRLQLQENTQLA